MAGRALVWHQKKQNCQLKIFVLNLVVWFGQAISKNWWGRLTENRDLVGRLNWL